MKLQGICGLSDGKAGDLRLRLGFFFIWENSQGLYFCTQKLANFWNPQKYCLCVQYLSRMGG